MTAEGGHGQARDCFGGKRRQKMRSYTHAHSFQPTHPSTYTCAPSTEPSLCMCMLALSVQSARGMYTLLFHPATCCSSCCCYSSIPSSCLSLVFALIGMLLLEALLGSVHASVSQRRSKRENVAPRRGRRSVFHTLLLAIFSISQKTTCGVWKGFSLGSSNGRQYGHCQAPPLVHWPSWVRHRTS